MMEFLSGLVLIAFIVWQQRYIFKQKLELEELETKVKMLHICEAYGIQPSLHKFGDEVVEQKTENE